MSSLTTWLAGSEEELELISQIWPAAYDLDANALTLLLTAARVQCEAYAPAADPIPDNYRLAQIYQARALARAGIAGTDGDLMAGTEVITAFPMDWSVKRLLNPERRIGGIA